MLWYFGYKLFESNVSLYALHSLSLHLVNCLQSYTHTHTDPRISLHVISSDPPHAGRKTHSKGGGCYLQWPAAIFEVHADTHMQTHIPIFVC